MEPYYIGDLMGIKLRIGSTPAVGGEWAKLRQRQPKVREVRSHLDPQSRLGKSALKALAGKSIGTRTKIGKYTLIKSGTNAVNYIVKTTLP